MFKQYFNYSNEKISGETYFFRLLISPIFLIVTPLHLAWVLAINYKRAKALGIKSSILCAGISLLMLCLLWFIFAAFFAPNWELALSDKILLSLSFIPFLIFIFKKSKYIEAPRKG